MFVLIKSFMTLFLAESFTLSCLAWAFALLRCLCFLFLVTGVADGDGVNERVASLAQVWALWLRELQLEGHTCSQGVVIGASWWLDIDRSRVHRIDQFTLWLRNVGFCINVVLNCLLMHVRFDLLHHLSLVLPVSLWLPNLCVHRVENKSTSVGWCVR